MPCAFCQCLNWNPLLRTQHGSRKNCTYHQNMSLYLHMKHHDSWWSSIQSLRMNEKHAGYYWRQKPTKITVKHNKKSKTVGFGGVSIHIYIYTYMCIHTYVLAELEDGRSLKHPCLHMNTRWCSISHVDCWVPGPVTQAKADIKKIPGARWIATNGEPVSWLSNWKNHGKWRFPKSWEYP